jgi:hypothetical protein
MRNLERDGRLLVTKTADGTTFGVAVEDGATEVPS